MLLGITFTLILFFLESETVNLCSVKKTDNNCICKRVTGEEQSSIVTEADCASSNLKIFPTQDQLTPDLSLLDLRHNRIVLDESKNNFSSTTLQTLLLSYNNISYVSIGFFKEISNLRKIILSHNNITSLDNGVFANCLKLSYVDLSFNNIKTIHEEVFLPLLQLRILDLSYNDDNLGTILTNSSNLRTLNISPNITTLKLDNLSLNDLHNFFFVNYTNLKHLSLADNRFQEIPTVPYSVEYLDLSGTDISVLQAKYLSYHSLKTLKLDRMKKLESIRHYAFYNLQALEELSIRNCHNLKEFNELIFGVLHKNMAFGLKRLSLSGNALQSLNSTYKNLFRTVDSIDLTDNPWNCNCDLLWLQEFDNLYKSDYIKCSAPLRLRSKKLIDITERDVPLCYPQKYGKKSHRFLIAFLSLLVILLSALVGYLIYYAPSWYNNRSRRLGPHSPYNMARVDED